MHAIQTLHEALLFYDKNKRLVPCCGKSRRTALRCRALLGENSVTHVAEIVGEAHPHPKQALSFGRAEDA